MKYNSIEEVITHKLIIDKINFKDSSEFPPDTLLLQGRKSLVESFVSDLNLKHVAVSMNLIMPREAYDGDMPKVPLGNEDVYFNHEKDTVTFKGRYKGVLIEKLSADHFLNILSNNSYDFVSYSPKLKTLRITDTSF